MRARVFMILVALAALLAWSGCGGHNQNAGAAAGPPPPSVTVATAEQRPVPIDLTAIGNAQPYRAVQLKSMVDGQINRVLLQQGEDVKAGQLLFQLDKRPFEAALAQAEGKLAQDTANAENSRANAERDRALFQSGVIAQQAWEQQQAQSKADAAAVQADRAAVQTARVNLGYTDIRAPIDARAGAILVNLGNLVKANDTNPLTTLNQVMPIYVQFNIPESQLQAVRAKGIGNLQVKASAPNDAKASAGTLTFVDNAVDATTGTIKLMATFQNRDRLLWPGEFLNVQLQLGVNPNATVVPATAVQSSQQGKYVYVVEQDGTAVMRSVTSSRTYEQLAVVESGVKAGERVIVDGQIRVAPNAKVNVVRTVPLNPTPEQVAESAGAAGMSGGRP